MLYNQTTDTKRKRKFLCKNTAFSNTLWLDPLPLDMAKVVKCPQAEYSELKNVLKKVLFTTVAQWYSQILIIYPQSTTPHPQFEFYILYSPSSYLHLNWKILQFHSPTLFLQWLVKSAGCFTQNVLKITGVLVRATVKFVYFVFSLSSLSSVSSSTFDGRRPLMDDDLQESWRSNA